MFKKKNRFLFVNQSNPCLNNTVKFGWTEPMQNSEVINFIKCFQICSS